MKSFEDCKNELPEVKGFFDRNLKRMTHFSQEYPVLLNWAAGCGPIGRAGNGKTATTGCPITVGT